MAKPGRPALPASYNTTFRLPPSLLDVVDSGASILATLSGTAASRAAWIRHLIDQTLPGQDLALITSVSSVYDLFGVLSGDCSMHKITLRLENHHRVLIRQYECYAQSLDWNLELYRNEALLLLIQNHGLLLNLELKKKGPIRKSTLE